MTEYQLMDFASMVGYTLETVDAEDAFDPAFGSHTGSEHRIRWPGEVLSIPTFREDYGHKVYSGVGSGPDPRIGVRHHAYYDVEIESTYQADTLAEGGSGFNDIFALFGGEFAEELVHGGETGPGFAVGDTVTDTTTTAAGTVRAVGPGNQLTVIRTTPANDFGNGNTIDNGSGTTAVLSSDPVYVIWFRRPQRGFTLEYMGFVDPDDPSASGNSWGHRLRGCRIDSITITGRPADLFLIRTKIYGRFMDYLTTETVGASGMDKLSDLVEHTNPGVHYKDMSLELRDNGGVDLIPDLDDSIIEWDITMTQNYTQVPANNQTLEAAKLSEGKRRFTTNIKTVKRNNRILDVSRANPAIAAGQISVTMILDQTDVTPGAYLKIFLGTTIWAERDAPTGMEIEKVEESFAALTIGIPSMTAARP